MGKGSLTLGRTRTFTSATVVSLVTDSPDVIQQSVLNSIARGTEISADIITNLMTGIASKLQTYYHIGNSHKGSVNLLPDSNLNLTITRILDVKYVLETIHGSSVSIHRCVLEPLNTDYLAYEYMANTYGYDFFTGTFQTVPNDMDVTDTFFSNSTLTDGALTIIYEDSEGNETYTEVTDITGIDTADYYYHTLYYVGSSNTLSYWNYNTSTGTYAFLSTTAYRSIGDYYPVVPIIEYTKNKTEEAYKDTAQYKLSKLLLNTIELKMDNISDSLKESDSYDQIQQAYFLPSVRMRDEDQLALKYLFNHFYLLGDNQKYGKSKFDAWLSIDVGNYGNPPANIMQYRMAGCKFDIEWLYIERNTVDGTWLYGTNEFARTYSISNQEVPNSDDARTIDTSSAQFLRKISNNQYEVVNIVGLTQTSYINDQYSKTWTVSDIFNTSEESADPMTIPVNPELTKRVFPKLLDRNTFTYRTYNLVLTFFQQVKVKWYQTTLFSFIVIVIAIVLTVWSAGTLASSMSSAYAAAGGGLAGAYAAASVAMTAAFYSAVTSWAMGELIKQYGWETAGIIAVIISAVAMAYGGFGDTDFSVSAFASTATNSITDYFASAIDEISAEMANLLEEYSSWEAEYDAMMEELFGISDSFAALYKQYAEDKAIYHRMVPSTFMFVTLELLLHEPEITTQRVELFVDNSLKATSEDELI